MDVFTFREELVAEYERFSRSFTTIRAEDILQVVDESYASGRFWPAPLIQLNPNFLSGGYIDDLVLDGALEEECAKIFRIKNSAEWLQAFRGITNATNERTLLAGSVPCSGVGNSAPVDQIARGEISNLADDQG